MSSEACPFCGKSFKRLKTHLPHCKAAPNSKTPPSKHSVGASDSSVTAGVPTEKVKKVPLPSSESLRPSSSLLTTSPSTKKKKLKSADQLDTTSSLLPPSPPSNPPIPKPKKKSLRALIEAAKSDQLTGGGPEDPRSFSPQSPRASADKGSPQFISADTKCKDAPKKKVKSKKASEFLESKVNECNTRTRTRDTPWVNGEAEAEDLTVRLNPQVRISLQNVKATLGRANGARRPEFADSPRSRMGPDAGEQNDAVTAAALWEQLQTLRNKDPKSKQPHSIQLQRDSPPPPPPPPPPAPPPPPPPQPNARHHVAGLLATSPALGQLSMPLRFPLQSPPARAETLQLQADKQNAAEKPAEDSVRTWWCSGSPSGLAVRTSLAGILTQRSRSLGQVTLRELPGWLACRTPSRPGEVVELLHGGWQWYYRRYIGVKNGGVAGVGMLLAGYCVLSYIWKYPHTKLDRWRKYH